MLRHTEMLRNPRAAARRIGEAASGMGLRGGRARDSGAPLVLDEIQKAPELVPALKRRTGQFVLTGSTPAVARLSEMDAALPCDLAPGS